MRELKPYPIGIIVDKSDAEVFCKIPIEPFVDHYHPTNDKKSLENIEPSFSIKHF